MKPRRAIRVEAEQRERSAAAAAAVDPFADVQLGRILKELSFVRIQIDEIVLTQPNPLIQRLNATKQLFGFQLEYQFPCLEVVSRALRATVRIPNRSATSTRIEFKHKRVVLLTMHQDQVTHWQRAKLNIHLLVQMEAAGKFTTRPLAKCSIPIYELLIAPYLICRDFDFVGADFEATALVRIDLGSRVKVLMEKLEMLRGGESETAAMMDRTFVVRENGRRTRSRSSSRCRSHRSSSISIRDGIEAEEAETENRKPARRRSTKSEIALHPTEPCSSFPTSSYQRPHSSLSSSSSFHHPLFERNYHSRPNSSIGSDSVFYRKPTAPTNIDVYSSAPDRLLKPSTNSSSIISEEIGYNGRRCTLEITVHEAIGLPPVEDQSGRIVSPNSFISILGREGELRSEVVQHSRQPKWNWTARFAMSSERRNLVVKVLHRGVMGDKALGFVTLTLPINSTQRAVFEITDVSQMNKFSSDIPMLVMSIEKIRNIVEEDDDEVFRKSVPSRDLRSPSPILETSQQLAEKMRKNMEELNFLMAGIRKS